MSGAICCTTNHYAAGAAICCSVHSIPKSLVLWNQQPNEWAVSCPYAAGAAIRIRCKPCIGFLAAHCQLVVLGSMSGAICFIRAQESSNNSPLLCEASFLFKGVLTHHTLLASKQLLVVMVQCFFLVQVNNSQAFQQLTANQLFQVVIHTSSREL